MAAAPTIVIARPVHSEIVADLHARCFRRGWTAEECEALLADRRVIGLLAIRKGFFRTAAVGFVLAREAAGEAEILSIGVAPNARGSGIGRLLLSHAIGHLKMRGAGSLFLEVEETNTPAIVLYEAFGFCARGRRESYYRDPSGTTTAALVLHLSLDEDR